MAKCGNQSETMRRMMPFHCPLAGAPGPAALEGEGPGGKTRAAVSKAGGPEACGATRQRVRAAVAPVSGRPKTSNKGVLACRAASISRREAVRSSASAVMSAMTPQRAVDFNASSMVHKMARGRLRATVKSRSLESPRAVSPWP